MAVRLEGAVRANHGDTPLVALAEDYPQDLKDKLWEEGLRRIRDQKPDPQTGEYPDVARGR